MTDLVVSRDRLYRLMPSLYRLRDASVGEPLRALFAVLESELSNFEDDVAGLYESYFIETCPEWVVPYLADLLDVRGLPPSRFLSARAYVAHTMGYRRRKGTLSALPDLNRDVTGWPTRAVESFPLLSRTQHLLNPRLQNVRTPLLRNLDALALAGSPFDSVQHTLDVRRKYHPGKLSLYQWRRFSIRARGHQAALLTAVDPNTASVLPFSFHPAGLSTALYSPGIPISDADNLAAQEASYPGPLRPVAIQAELSAWERAAGLGVPPESPVYFGTLPVFRVVLERADQSRTEIKPADMVTMTIAPQSGPVVLPARVGTPYQAGVDVAQGYLALPRDLAPAGTRVLVDFSYGAAAEIGGGYPHSPSPFAEDAANFELISVRGGETSATSCVLSDALAQILPSDSDTPRAVVLQIEDSLNYRLKDITLGRNISLELRAAAGHRPFLVKYTSATLGAPLTGAPAVTATLGDGATLSLDGVYCPRFFAIRVAPGAQARCDLHHVNANEFQMQAGGSGCALLFSARRSQLGFLREGAGLQLTAEIMDSVITQVMLPGSSVTLRGCTVLTSTSVRELTHAQDSLFAGTVTTKSAVGTLRYCYVPPGSVTPPGYRCLPDVVAREGGDPSLCRPVFAAQKPEHSERYRLAPVTHRALFVGSSDGGELGVMHHVGARQRERAQQEALADYLPLNLEAELYSAT